MTVLTPAYRARIYASRSVDPTEATVLTPAAGAPHSDPFQVATVRGIPGYKPYLAASPSGRKGRVDFVSKKTDIGSRSISLLDQFIDPTSSTNAQRWVTAFTGDANAKSALLALRYEEDESLDGGATWRRIYTGRVSDAKTKGDVEVTISLKDLMDALDQDAFVGDPLGVSYARRLPILPLGLTEPWAGLPATAPLLPGIAQDGGSGPFRLTIQTGSSLTDDHDVLGHMKVPRALADLANRTFTVGLNLRLFRFALKTVRVAVSQGGVFHSWWWLTRLYAEQVDEFDATHWRPVSLAVSPAPELYPGASPPAFPTGSVTWALYGAASAVSAGSPILLDAVDPMVLLTDLVDGRFSRPDPQTGLPIPLAPRNAAAFTALEGQFPPWRGFVRGKAKMRTWAAEYVCQAMQLALVMNAAGAIEPIDLRRGEVDEDLESITDPEVMHAKGSEGFSQVAGDAVTRLLTPQDFVTQLDRTPDFAKIKDEYPDVPPGMLAVEEIPIEYVNLDPRSLDFPDKALTVKFTGLPVAVPSGDDPSRPGGTRTEILFEAIRFSFGIALARCSGRNITGVTVHNNTSNADLALGSDYTVDPASGWFTVGDTGNVDPSDEIEVTFTEGPIAAPNVYIEERQIESTSERLAHDLFAMFGRGARYVTLECRRTGVAEATEPGMRRILDTSKLPNPTTNLRGGGAVGLCIERSENQLQLTLVFVLLGLFVQSDPPVLGPPASVAEDCAHSATLEVTLNAAGDPVVVEIAPTAIGDPRPADDSPLWLRATRVTVSGDVTLTDLPSARRVHLRTRSEPVAGVGAPFPSAWTAPPPAFVDTCLLDAITGCALDTSGPVRMVTWDGGDDGLPVYIAVDGIRVASLDPGTHTWNPVGYTGTVAISQEDGFGSVVSSCSVVLTDPGPCTDTTWNEVVDPIAGTLALDMIDPAGRLLGVRFSTQAGTDPPTPLTAASGPPWEAEVARIPGVDSWIRYEVTWLGCDGTTKVVTGEVRYPYLVTDPPPGSDGGGSGLSAAVPVVVSFILEDRGYQNIGAGPTRLGGSRITSLDLSGFGSAIIPATIDLTTVPAGTALAFMYRKDDGTAAFLDGATDPAIGGPRLLVDPDNVAPWWTDGSGEDAIEGVMQGLPVAIVAEARRRVNVFLVHLGGDGTGRLGAMRVDLQLFPEPAGAEDPEQPDDDEPPPTVLEPCDTGTFVSGDFATLAAFYAAGWSLEVSGNITATAEVIPDPLGGGGNVVHLHIAAGSTNPAGAIARLKRTVTGLDAMGAFATASIEVMLTTPNFGMGGSGFGFTGASTFSWGSGPTGSGNYHSPPAYDTQTLGTVVTLPSHTIEIGLYLGQNGDQNHSFDVYVRGVTIALDVDCTVEVEAPPVDPGQPGPQPQPPPAGDPGTPPAVIGDSPFGLTDQYVPSLWPTYSGLFNCALYKANIVADTHTHIALARSLGMKLLVMLQGSKGQWMPNGVFVLGLYLRAVRRFASDPIIAAAIADGTIFGFYLHDEANLVKRYGRFIEAWELQTEVDVYREVVGNDARLFFRMLPETYNHRFVGLTGYYASWHTRRGDLAQYLARFKANSLRLGALEGLASMNVIYLDGTGIYLGGEYPDRRSASAADIDRYGAIIARDTFITGFASWRYDAAQLGQPGVLAAFGRVGQLFQDSRP